MPQDLSVTELVLVELGGADDEAADDEVMQVGVSPAEGGLDLVELGEVELAGQQDPPPDWRLDLVPTWAEGAKVGSIIARWLKP